MRTILYLMISLVAIIPAAQSRFAFAASADEVFAHNEALSANRGYFILETADWKPYQARYLKGAWFTLAGGAGETLAEAIKKKLTCKARHVDRKGYAEVQSLAEMLDAATDEAITGLSVEDTIRATAAIEALRPIQLRVQSINMAGEPLKVRVEEVFRDEIPMPSMGGGSDSPLVVAPPEQRRVSGEGENFAKALMKALFPAENF